MAIKLEVQKVYPCTPMQEGMLFQSLMNDGSNAYFEQTVFYLRGQLDQQRLEQSFNLLIKRHEIFRTNFIHDKTRTPQQVVLKERELTVAFHDLSSWDEETKQWKLEQFKRQDRDKGFDLSRDLLIRIALLKLDEERSAIVWSHHHILMDGWCIGIVMKDLMKLYDGLNETNPVELERTVPYLQFIQWLERQERSEAKQYWAERLHGYEQRAVIPVKRETSSDLPVVPEHTTYRLSSELTDALERLAQVNHVTVNTVVQTVWGILLQRYNHTDDVVFGAVVSGRPSEINGIENMVGLFINTVPVRVQGSGMPFQQLLQAVQQASIQSEPYHYYPLYEIQASSELKHQLIHHIIAFENFPLQEQVEQVEQTSQHSDSGFVIEKVEQFEETHYDFTVVVEPGAELAFHFKYNANLYDRQFVERIGSHFEQAVSSIIRQPDIAVARIEIVTEAEVTLIRGAFNATTTDYPRNSSIHELFAEQAAKAPDHTAVVFESESYTYSQLDEMSNNLARLLRGRGVKSDELVAIMAGRSLDTVAGMLGILKAGAAYLPIDPAYPEDRIQYMLTDSGARLLLTASGREEAVGSFGGETVALSGALRTPRADGVFAPAANGSWADLAYVMYTSGSTGQPKGVMIEHRSVVRLVKNTNYASFEPGDRILQTGATAFDACTFEIWGALLNGLTLYIVDEDTILDGEKLAGAIRGFGITTMWLTSPLFNQLSGEQPDMFSGMKQLLVGGDVLSGVHIERVRQACPGLTITNGYGPTENTTFSVCCRIDQDFGRSIPIGRPISNSTAYIMDAYGQLKPLGVPGELWVGGDGVARGYLNQPELTEQKFIPDPNGAGGKLYRTGDLARMLQDGQIEYIGRIDQQVKIRGYRIELSEIENQLLLRPDVQDAVVLARTAGNQEKSLCAYIVCSTAMTAAEWRAYLAERLPEYMIPSAYLTLERIPLTPNGKVDKPALALLDVSSAEDNAACEEPVDELEASLARLWQDVLGLSRAARRHDHFFALGGHSLKATQLVNHIRKTMDIRLPIHQIFQYPVLRQMANAIRSSQEARHEPIPPAETAAYYPVSSAQKRMIMLEQLDAVHTAYNVPGVYKISGDLDVPRLRSAFEQLIACHEILRTSFEFREGVPVQLVHPQAELQLELTDGREEDADSYMETFVQPFDLGAAPLMRVALIRCAPRTHLLLLDLHHVITDGTSMSLLVEQLVQVYEGALLEPPMLHYKDYAAWQQQEAQSSDQHKQEKFWLEQLNGSIPVLELPYDFPRPAKFSFAGDRISFPIEHALYAKLKQLSVKTGSTLFVTLLSAYQILLAKLSGQQDIIVGTPVAGRSHVDMQAMMGLFVNTVAFRLCPESHKTVSRFMEEARSYAIQAFANQDYPFEQLVNRLELKRDVSRNALFDTMFVLQNMNASTSQPSALTVEPCLFDHPLAKFDLTLSAAESEEDGTLGFSLEYGTRLFRKETAERFAAYYVRVLEQIAAQPELRIGELTLLSPEDERQLLYQWNDTSAGFPREATIQRLFELQAAKGPDRIALQHEDRIITYGQLNARANQLARLLVMNGAGRERIVAVVADRSIDMIVAILAIMKSGGAYLPIDPSYPQERIQFMLDNSGASWIVSDQSRDTALAGVRFNGTELRLDDPEIDAQDGTDMPCANEPADMAYIIYTSGTTGTPKGTVIEHRNVVRLLFNDRFPFQFGENDVWTLFHSYCFDFSVWEMYGALLYGGKLVIVPKETSRNPAAFLDLMKRTNVTVLNQTPTAFYHLIQEEARQERELQLRYVIFGGEALSPLMLAPYRQRYPHTQLINMYGITETTVHVTFKPITEHEITNNISGIGLPIPTLTAYVMDESRRLVPIGVNGELYVGGEGVCRGYLNRPELTAERFVDHPYIPGVRLYKSGDMARRLPSGELVYVGRLDHQVKIRGHRIELAEVEAALLKQEGVREVVVIPRDDKEGTAHLCSYFVADVSAEHVTPAELRSAMRAAVPDYMVPSYFIPLDRIPLTPNGKVDRQALPAPEDRASGEAGYEAPRNEIEETLAAIFSDVLGAKRVGIQDDFYELGGDSIKAIQVSSRLHPYGYAMDVKDLFQYPTIAELSRHIRNLTVLADQGAVHGEVPLTPVQHWFFEQQFTDRHHYNQSVMLYFEQGIEEAVLQKLLHALVLHHDALRMVYTERDGRAVQINQNTDVEGYHLSVHDLRDKADVEAGIESLADRIQSSMELGQGPLLKAGLFQTRDGDHLLLAIHHLVVDGVSWRILLEDLKLGLEQAARNEAIRFQPKTHSYQAFAQGLVQYAATRKAAKERAYWLNIEQADVKPLTTGRESGARTTRKQSETLHMELSQEHTEQLLKRVHRAYNTEINDVLLTALGLAFHAWRGMDRIRINLEGHGRETIIEGLDISRTVGWFTTMYPVLIDTHAPASYSDSERLGYIMKRVKDDLHRIPDKGIGYGILAYLAEQEQPDVSKRSRVPEISFNYLGQFDQDIQEEGAIAVSPLSPGNSLSPNMERVFALDLNGMVTGGRLLLSFNFDPHLFTEDEIGQLIMLYHDQLALLIEHCVAKENSERTASDYTSKDLSLEELGDIEDIVNSL